MRIEIRKEPDARALSVMEPGVLQVMPQITVIEMPAAWQIGFGLVAGGAAAAIIIVSIMEIVIWLAT